MVGLEQAIPLGQEVFLQPLEQELQHLSDVQHADYKVHAVLVEAVREQVDVDNQ